MGAKVYADYPTREGAPASPDPELELPLDAAAMPVSTALPSPIPVAGASPVPGRSPNLPSPIPPAADEASVETDVQAVAAWFEALPDEWRSYFDREAESGQRAYGQA